MKATHIDYLHKGHLRVVTGKTYLCYDSRGYYETDAECVSPGAKSYKDLYRKGLPKWEGPRTIAKERPDLNETATERHPTIEADLQRQKMCADQPLHKSKHGWTTYAVQGFKGLSNHHITDDGLIGLRVTPDDATHAIIVECEEVEGKLTITSKEVRSLR